MLAEKLIVTTPGGRFEFGSAELEKEVERLAGGDSEYAKGAADALFMRSVLGDEPYKTGTRPGVFHGALNLGYWLESYGFKLNESVHSDAAERYLKGVDDGTRAPWPEDWGPDSYGVADTEEQILEYLKYYINHPSRLFVISITTMKRDVSNAGKGGGWRWHKWGTYVGTQQPQMEYLDDEPEIDQALVFSIIEIMQEDADAE